MTPRLLVCAVALFGVHCTRATPPEPTPPPPGPCPAELPAPPPCVADSDCAVFWGKKGCCGFVQLPTRVDDRRAVEAWQAACEAHHCDVECRPKLRERVARCRDAVCVVLDASSEGAPDAGRRPRLQPGLPQFEPDVLDREAVVVALRARLPALQRCYERRLAASPELHGALEVRFVLDRDGRTSRVEVEQATLGDEAVAGCVAALVGGWSFAFRPPAPVAVRQRLVFSHE